jgi:4-hydroxybenzoate polyprenyltransferase
MMRTFPVQYLGSTILPRTQDNAKSIARTKNLSLLGQPRPWSNSWIARSSYHIYTLWLFTQSQIKDTIVPCALFGLFGALSGPILSFSSPKALNTIIHRLILALFYTWLNALLFCLSNQIQPDSIKEDAMNKPWRPLPSGRCTPGQANWLLLVTHVVTLSVDHIIGGLPQSMLLAFLTIWYNRWGGAERPLERNLLNTFGFACFLSGALDVTVGSEQSVWNPRAITWVCTAAALIGTTIQVQDFRDVIGDHARGRRTILSAIGDAACRRTVVLGVSFWSVSVPAYWESGFIGYLLPISFGTCVVVRTLAWRDLSAEKLTYKLWSFWVMSFFPLPWLKAVK